MTEYFRFKKSQKEIVEIRFDRYPDNCPCCEHRSNFKIESHYFHQLFDDSGRYDGGTILQLVTRCTREQCGRIFIAEYYLSPNQIEELDSFELTGTQPPLFTNAVGNLISNNKIPKDVRSDLSEAAKCYYSGLYQAFGAMARRVVHSMCTQEYAEGENLYKQVEYLRGNNKFTKEIADRAQELRTLGRNGSHPEWELVTDEMAEKGMEHLLWLVQTFYLIPEDQKWREQHNRRYQKIHPQKQDIAELKN